MLKSIPATLNVTQVYPRYFNFIWQILGFNFPPKTQNFLTKDFSSETTFPTWKRKQLKSFSCCESLKAFKPRGNKEQTTLKSIFMRTNLIEKDLILRLTTAFILRVIKCSWGHMTPGDSLNLIHWQDMNPASSGCKGSHDYHWTTRRLSIGYARVWNLTGYRVGYCAKLGGFCRPKIICF